MATHKIRYHVTVYHPNLNMCLACLYLACLYLACMYLACMYLACMYLACMYLACLYLACLYLACLHLACLYLVVCILRCHINISTYQQVYIQYVHPLGPIGACPCIVLGVDADQGIAPVFVGTRS
jgi:hypothetical protein